MLVEARFEGGAPLDDAEIRDQLMTLLLAGHETTATGLAWTFDLLVRHPAVLERLVTEVDAGEQAYVRAVVAESLRLRPVVPLAGRRLAAPLAVNGYELPAGTDVTPAIWLAHTRADRYPEPFAFRPERFLDGAPSTFAWIPFGGGVRRCIGAAFAEMEMRVALAEILRRKTVRAASGAAERVARRNVTFSPAGGTRLIAAIAMILYLLRHAKSSWEFFDLPDHDRPLAPRGERAAKAMAQHLREQGIAPEVVLCSTATRARETLERVGLEGVLEPGLYGASAATLLKRVQEAERGIGDAGRPQPRPARPRAAAPPHRAGGAGAKAPDRCAGGDGARRRRPRRAARVHAATRSGALTASSRGSGR